MSVNSQFTPAHTPRTNWVNAQMVKNRDRPASNNSPAIASATPQLPQKQGRGRPIYGSRMVELVPGRQPSNNQNYRGRGRGKKNGPGRSQPNQQKSVQAQQPQQKGNAKQRKYFKRQQKQQQRSGGAAIDPQHHMPMSNTQPHMASFDPNVDVEFTADWDALLGIVASMFAFFCSIDSRKANSGSASYAALYLTQYIRRAWIGTQQTNVFSHLPGPIWTLISAGLQKTVGTRTFRVLDTTFPTLTTVAFTPAQFCLLLGNGTLSDGASGNKIVATDNAAYTEALGFAAAREIFEEVHQRGMAMNYETAVAKGAVVGKGDCSLFSVFVPDTSVMAAGQLVRYSGTDRTFFGTLNSPVPPKTPWLARLQLFSVASNEAVYPHSINTSTLPSSLFVHRFVQGLVHHKEGKNDQIVLKVIENFNFYSTFTQMLVTIFQRHSSSFAPFTNAGSTITVIDAKWILAVILRRWNTSWVATGCGYVLKDSTTKFNGALIAGSHQSPTSFFQGLPGFQAIEENLAALRAYRRGNTQYYPVIGGSNAVLSNTVAVYAAASTKITTEFDCITGVQGSDQISFDSVAGGVLTAYMKAWRDCMTAYSPYTPTSTVLPTHSPNLAAVTRVIDQTHATLTVHGMVVGDKLTMTEQAILDRYYVPFVWFKQSYLPGIQERTREHTYIERGQTDISELDLVSGAFVAATHGPLDNVGNANGKVDEGEPSNGLVYDTLAAVYEGGMSVGKQVFLAAAMEGVRMTIANQNGRGPLLPVN